MAGRGRPRKQKEVVEASNNVKEVVEVLDKKLGKKPTLRKKKVINPDDLFPAGCTMVNLAMSDTPNGGWSKGKINTFPGGSSSGKTFCVLSSLAEIAHNPMYDDWELIFDDVESALEFNVEDLFGKKTQERLKAPRYDKNGNPIFSNTIQEFKNNILQRTTNKQPFIWILDSWDALTSDEEVEKSYKAALKAAKSAEHVKELKGSYKTEKAKIGGEILRMIKRELKETGSLLILLQQTRQKLGAMAFEKKDITSGGNAPFFYSTHQAWSNKKKTLKDKDTGLIIGQRVKLDITKNKLTGKKRSVEFDLYDDYGIDNINSIIDFLLEIEHWKKSGRKIKAVELELELERNDLVQEIEDNDLEDKLIQIVTKAWNDREDSVKITRKRRF